MNNMTFFPKKPDKFRPQFVTSVIRCHVNLMRHEREINMTRHPCQSFFQDATLRPEKKQKKEIE